MSTIIGGNLKVTGTIEADEPVAIVGPITADLLVPNHDVTVEANGRIDGAITARSITVFGGSMGRLIARDIVRVLGSATVRGDVAAPRMELALGAVFNGRVEPSRTEAAIRVAAYRQHNGTGRPD
jgi:cytoskeletal protein CcmA (bactofilin family)